MPTKSIYAPKTEDNDYEQLNTASVLIDFDRDIIEVGSLQTLKANSVMVRVSIRKDTKYECTFDKLQVGVLITKGAEVILEDKLEGVICTDQRYIMMCNVPPLVKDQEYTLQVWCHEGNSKLTFRENFTVPDYEDQTTEMENPVGTVVYHDGYYPDDEQWERDQPYLPEGYVRPVPPT